MNKKLFYATSLLTVAALSSCGKMGGLSADNFNVTPTPLELSNGEVEATINGNFPEKYMKKNAVVTVTPILKYANMQVPGQGATFQGEKVEGNDRTISYKVGGRYTMKSTFKYVPEMANSDLYLHFDAKRGNKTVKIPEVKVGYGVLATSGLVADCMKSANPAMGEDHFQRVINEKKEASIKFLIAQSNLRNSELKSISVQEFIKTIKEIAADQENKALNYVEVSAYASPDGGYALNEKLAKNREKTSTNYVNSVLKKSKLDGDVDAKYTAEDWDGFQELVANSKLQDKEVILRVLSMYQDPEEREQQIRNISTVYKNLADEILPQLRRARMTINYEVIGRSDDAIMEEYNKGAKNLSVEEMVYAANMVVEDPAQREAWYKKTIEMYPNDYRSYNNLAVMAYQKGDINTALDYLAKAQKVNAAAPEVNTNLGMIALRNGDIATADAFMAKGGGNTIDEARGNLYVAQGKYAQAAQLLKGNMTNGAALAQIMNKDYASAKNTLANIKNSDAITAYLKAIVAARTNNPSEAKQMAAEAMRLDPSLKTRIENDLELK